MKTLNKQKMTDNNNVMQKQKRKKFLVFALMAIAFAVCMWLIFAPSAKDREEQLQGAGFNSEIPDPRGDGIVGDKKTAYEQEQLRLKQEEKMSSLQDYTYMLGAQDETEEERAAREERQLRMAPKPVEYYDNPELFEQNSPSKNTARSSAVQSSGTAYRDLNATLGNFYEEPAVDNEKEELRAQVEMLRMQVQEQSDSRLSVDEQLAMLERSYELAAKYSGNMQQQQQPVPVEQPVAGKKTKVVAVGQIRTDVVSMLAAPMSDLEFVQMFSQPRNTGFNTVGGDDAGEERNTIPAVVHGNQVLIDGQSVRLRTTDAIRAGKIIIPRNTVITGQCKIGGERLEITVSSIEYEGNLIPVELSAYDSDGQKGIYIPGSMELQAVKEIVGNMGQNLGTTINLNQQSAGEQLITDVGRGLLQGTSQYVSKKARQVKITLKAGYKLMLLPGENN